jgi:SAM-dependent methyltransferase
MSRFANAAFDFAFFSFNGIDYIPNDDRIKALGEINRVLSRGGVLLFSSHNRNSLAKTVQSPVTKRRRSPAQLIKRGLKIAWFAPRRWRLRRHELQTDDYAVVADSGLHYSLLTYYVTPRRQREQLELTGFRVTGMYDAEGHETDDQDQSPWLHYLATKLDSASS